LFLLLYYGIMLAMEIKMIASDLDGTLLGDDHLPSERTIEALKKAYDAGIAIVPVTGRSFSHLPKWIREAEYIDYVITVNGARGINNKTGETIFTETMETEQMLRAMRMVLPFKTCWNLHANKFVWREEHGTPDIRPMLTQELLLPDMMTYLENNEMEIEKIDIYFADMKERAEAFRLSKDWDDVAVCAGSDFNFEVNSLRGNKGQGLKLLAEKLGISLKNVAAFGDALNDLPLIKAAGVSVAMGNAVTELKEEAKFITNRNDEDGVANFIFEKILSINI